MIQSPRGSKEIIAHNSFTTQSSDSADSLDRSRPTHHETIHSNTDSDNQLVWSNPTIQTLNPQIIRQLAYSNTLPYSYYYHNYYYYYCYNYC